jgi:hypothetical protein
VDASIYKGYDPIASTSCSEIVLARIEVRCNGTRIKGLFWNKLDSEFTREEVSFPHMGCPPIGSKCSGREAIASIMISFVDPISITMVDSGRISGNS